MATELRVDNVVVNKGGKRLVDGASFSLSAGEFVVLLGPNGAGKSTLLRSAAGLQAATSGAVMLDDGPIGAMSAAERARKLAYLPQVRELAWPLTVRDVVALGRFAHGAAPHRLSPVDRQAVEQAIEQCGLSGFEGRKTDSLSGGELARVHCARVFAAQTPLMIVDEPVAALDPLRQHETAALLKKHARGGGGVLAVLHDIALAGRYADRLIWMREGRIVADGAVGTTLTPDIIRDVFDVDASMIRATEGVTVSILGPAETK